MSSSVEPGQAVTERRVVTVLFADIVGSTEAAASRDVEQIRAGLAIVFDRARLILEAHGGTVEKFIGDAVMAVFGIPRGHDDDPERAVRAAIALHRMAEGSASSVGFPVRFRIGINSGEVATGSGGAARDFLVTGQPVNVGARLYPAAEPGRILVGSLTKALTESAIRYGEALELDAKGIGTLQAWRVEGVLAAEPGAPPRGLPGLRAPMIGRDAELALLGELMARAVRERRPHLVTILADAGVGKSRLLREFMEGSGTGVRVGRCLPYGEGIEYHPIRAVICEEASVEASEDAASAADKLRAHVRTLWPDDTAEAMADRLAILAGFADASRLLPGVTADDLTAELRWALRKLISRSALREPLVLVFEDVHWATPRLLDLIEDLGERTEGMLLVCCLARPELVEGRPGWGTHGPHASTIRLSPLDAALSQRLVLELLKVARLPKGLVAGIVDRSGGNPLYLEEILRALIARGDLRSSGDGWQATSTTTPADVPETLRGVVTARLDRLSAPAKRLLQRGSVLGRYFPLRGVRALASDDSPRADVLHEAVRSDFLVATDEAPSRGGATYHFRHALIRDAVYASIAKQDRRRMHERAAEWLERDQAERGEDLRELVAHHLEQAFWLGEELGGTDRDRLGRRAYSALTAVARRERNVMNYPSAAALYGRAERIATALAIPVAERKDDVAWHAVTRHPPHHGELDQSDLFGALELVRGLGPTTGLAQLLSFASQHAGDDGRALAAEGLEVARATGDPEAIAWSLWLSLSVVGPSDPAQSWALQEETLEIARRHNVTPLLSFALQAMAERAHNEGKVTRSRELREEAYAHARATGAKIAIAAAATGLALWHGDVREAERIRPYIDEGLAAAREVNNPQQHALFLLRASVAAHQSGLLEQARGHAAEALTLFDPAAWPGTAFGAHRELARNYAALGDAASARAHEQAMRPLARNHSDRVELLIASARVAVAEGDTAEAEQLYRQAIEEMERPEGDLFAGYARWDAIRSATQVALADVLASLGRSAEARELLRAAHAFWSDPLASRRRAEIEAELAALSGSDAS